MKDELLPRLPQLLSLAGKQALVTGAASGIGRAIAHRLAEAGARLDLVDIDHAALIATQQQVAVWGYAVNIHVVDLASKAAIDELWARLRGNEPDILINNAGIYPCKDFVDVEEAFYQRVIATNLDAVYWMCQHLIRSRRQVGGVIVNIGSIEAVLPFKDDLAHYSVSKAGVIALTRALAKEHARHGFRVNAILPGGIATQGTTTMAKEIMHGNFDLLKAGIEFWQRLPVGRLGQPDEVARLVLVLASDLAAYVHGAVIPVDGGFLAA